MIMPAYSPERFVRESLERDFKDGRRIYKTCMGIALKITGNRDDAEDCVSEAYSKAIQNAGSYDCAWKLITWVGRIARNCAFNVIRRETRFKGAPVDRFEGVFEAGSEDNVLEEERAREVREAIRMLTFEKRTAIALRDYDNVPYKDMAVIMRVSRETARKRTFGARKDLRDNLRLSDLVA